MRVIVAFLVNTVCNFAIGLLVAKFLGPEEFGRFALAMAVGVVMQAGLFDWIRLAATRFYSARAGAQEPDLRATLDVAFALVAFVLGALAVGGILLALAMPMPRALIGLAAALQALAADAPVALAVDLDQEHIVGIEMRADATTIAGIGDHQIVQARLRHEAQIRVVVAQQQPVFGPRRVHSIRFVVRRRRQVVDKHPQV